MFQCIEMGNTAGFMSTFLWFRYRRGRPAGQVLLHHH